MKQQMLEKEVAELKAQRENVAQAMSETHGSWEQRCHAMAVAFGYDFGEFQTEIPEVGSYYQVNLSRKDKEIEILTKQVIDLINQNAELIKDKLRTKQDLHVTLYEGEWSSDSWNLVDQIRSEIT